VAKLTKNENALATKQKHQLKKDVFLLPFEELL